MKYMSVWERLADMLHYHMWASFTGSPLSERVVVDLVCDGGYARRIVKVFPKHGSNGYGSWCTDSDGRRLFIRVKEA